jgi:uncharacterized protein (TIGR03382 family)
VPDAALEDYTISLTVENVVPTANLELWRNGSELNTLAARASLVLSAPAPMALVCTYQIGGSADAGLDYTALSGTCVIPEGGSEYTILIQPIQDNYVEGTETVVLTLNPAPGGEFVLGDNASLAVVLEDDDVAPLPFSQSCGSAGTVNGAAPLLPLLLLLGLVLLPRRRRLLPLLVLLAVLPLTAGCRSAGDPSTDRVRARGRGRAIRPPMRYGEREAAGRQTIGWLAPHVGILSTVQAEQDYDTAPLVGLTYAWRPHFRSRLTWEVGGDAALAESEHTRSTLLFGRAGARYSLVNPYDNLPLQPYLLGGAQIMSDSSEGLEHNQEMSGAAGAIDLGLGVTGRKGGWELLLKYSMVTPSDNVKSMLMFNFGYAFGGPQ